MTAANNDAMSPTAIAVRTAGVFAVLRLLFGLLLVLLSFVSREASILVIADVPTLAAYWLLQQFGMTAGIRDAFDVRFFVIGVAAWAVFGYSVAWAAVVVLDHRRRKPAGRSR